MSTSMSDAMPAAVKLSIPPLSSKDDSTKNAKREVVDTTYDSDEVVEVDMSQLKKQRVEAASSAASSPCASK